MDATSAGSARTRRAIALTLALFALLLTATADGAQASSYDPLPLPGSTFTAADGDQTAGGAFLDWQSYANVVTSTIDSPVPATTGPDYYYKGHEDSPDTWVLDSVDGGISPPKSNALAAFSLKDPLAGDQFLYFAFFRASTSNANTFFGLELNKRTNTWVNSAGTTIPCRSTGDLLISYEIDPSSKNVIFTAYKWTGGLPAGPASCPEGRTGSYSPVTLGIGDTQGYMNFDDAITNYLATSTSTPAGPLPTSFDAGTFGEGAVNLTQTIGTGANPCFNFGQIQLHSRSSSSLSSALQDTVDPTPIILRQCTASGTKFEDSNANGVKDPGEPGLAGWRMYVDSDGDGAYDVGEPFAITSDGSAGAPPIGTYTIGDISAGSQTIREAPPTGDTSTWRCGPTPGPTGTLSSGGVTPTASCHYTQTFVASSNFTAQDFGNYRNPTIEVVKNLVPAADAGRFDLKIDGVTKKANAGDTDTTTPQSVALGTAHTLTETGASAPSTSLSDYTSSYSCTTNGQSSLSGAGTSIAVAAAALTSGDALMCTFTNTRHTTLTVIKQVDNGDGGSNVAGDWTMDVTSSGANAAHFAGTSAGHTITINPGAFSVGETAAASVPAGAYTLSSAVGCSATASVGQHYTCTLVNDDVAPTLTVIKTVVNKHGSTATASDFTMHIDGSAGSESFAGAVSPGTTKTLHAGGYDVTETGAATANYSATESGDCHSTLAIGDAKTCTITNTRKTGMLTVVKDLIPSTDSGRFDLKIDSAVVRSDAGDGDGSGAVEVNTGTRTVSEVAGSVGDVGDYASGIACDNGASGSGRGPLDVDVTSGSNITCTITNTRDTTLTVIKQVDNGDGGSNVASDWTMDVTSSGANAAHFAGTSAGHTIIINPGAFSVGETAAADVPAGAYSLASAVGCSATASVGEHYTCTLVNDDVAPTLTVVKTVVNKHGSTALSSDFTMHIAGGAGTDAFAGAASPGTTKTLHAGTYDVTETGAATADYSAVESGACHGALAVGDAKTCTITNTRKTGTITVLKDLIPSTDSGRFDLKIDSTVVRSDAGDGDGSGAIEVNTGAHTVSEAASSTGSVGDYVSSIACDNDASASGRGPLDVAVTSGASITCTITNTRKATVTVRKVTDPADPGATQFAFASALPAIAGPPAIAADGTFSLSDGASVTTSVVPGTYAVSENDPRLLGYKLVGLSCTESAEHNSTVATGAAISSVRNATINADAGETISCTFTNRKILAQPVVVKAGDTFAYHDGVASYTFAVSNTGNSPLHDVHVSDDKCPNVSIEPASRTNDNGDALLDPIGANGTSPEVWVFTCTYTIGAHQAGEANPVINTATVTALDEFDRPVTDTDQHSTALLHPAIVLVKSGPATALAGSLVAYVLAATNTGDVAFVAPLVMTDARCEAPPTLIDTGTDTSTATLDPGDSWRYTCSVQTAVGQTSVHNVATVDGSDVHGHHAVAEAGADTALTQPVVPPAVTRGVSNPVAVVPLVAARARLRGPGGCMAPAARFVVTGARIAKVTFSIDGRRVKTLRTSDKQGRYVYTARRTPTRTGVHRVRAQIVFAAGSTLKSKTLRMTFTKCARAVRPAFTG